MIELIALVLEDGHVAEDGKPMGKALGDEELAMVILRKFDGYMLAIGGTALADIDGDIEYSTLDTTDEFGLSERRTLEMETAHHAVSGFALVVLNKFDWLHFLIKLPLGEGFGEIATTVFEDTWLDNQQTVNRSLDNVHCS